MESKSMAACVIVVLLSAAAVIVLASSSYDSIECDPHSNKARTGRARLIESIPCDLSKQSYCNLPGESYPWNAVKRFVYDNQGLVRRMYGDQRHIFVMQSELENEIDFDDIKHTADKYSKSFNDQHRPRTRQAKAKRAPTVTTTTTTKRNAERKNYRSGDASEPHFRPAHRPAATNSKQRTKPPKVGVGEQSEKSALLDNLIHANADAKVTTKLTPLVPSSTPTAAATEIIGDALEESDRAAVDKAVLDLLGNISSALAASSTITTSTTTTTTTTLKPSTTSSEALTANETSESTVGDLRTTLVADQQLGENENDNDEEEDEETTVVSSATAEATSEQPTKESTVTTTTEAQLYQDHAIVPTLNRRGVNACPVKEEVVAPFWGNNTRGEILALLNVYPFEQYINWEKCTHEHEQMYCRKGCRCEQQYRLHRLLAYNPLDACRGIFSDWFRFPSCCICKCYDIPFDYRVTSRSPRGSEKVLDAIDGDEAEVEVEVEGEEFSLFDYDDDDENHSDEPE